MNRSPIDLLNAPVELIVLRDGKPLMTQTFQHTPIRIGRILDNDIVLPFDSVSRHHCELRYQDGKWNLVDLKSMNGILVKGEKVTNAFFEETGEFELKPVLIQIHTRQPVANVSEPAVDSKEADFISPSDATLVGATQVGATFASFHSFADSTEGDRALLNVNSLDLMSEPHPLAEDAKTRAVQVSVFWSDVLISVDEFLPGEEMIVEINGIYLRLGRAGKDRSEVRCPNGTQFSNRPGRESVLLTTTPVLWKADWGLKFVARYVPQSKISRARFAPAFDRDMIDPIVISGLVHGAIAIANFTVAPKADSPKAVPNRIAKIIVPALAPPPLVTQMPAPTQPPILQPTPTPIAVLPTPITKPKVAIKPTPEPMKVVPRPTAARVAETTVQTVKSEKTIQKENPIPRTLTDSNRRPRLPLATASATPTPRPFDASSVGALKALSLLNAPLSDSTNTEKIIVRKTASDSADGRPQTSQPSTTSILKTLPQTENRQLDGQNTGSLALKISSVGSGYGTAGFSGKTGKRNVMGSVIGGADFTEPTKTEGLSREQVMKVVQNHHGEIQQCYERNLMTDPHLAGRAEFEWEISAKGSVMAVNIKETNLKNGESLLECVKNVFRNMKFPSAKNGASTTPTIGLPFGRL